MIQDPDDDGDEGLEVDFSVLTCRWAWLGRKMFNTEKPQKMLLTKIVMQTQSPQTALGVSGIIFLPD